MLAGTNWSEWVGIGTLALAGVTLLAVLVGIATALSTKRAASAAQSSADADRLSLEASIRPLLIHAKLARRGRTSSSADFESVAFPGQAPEQVPIGGVGVFSRSPTLMEITVPVRNVGRGAALISDRPEFRQVGREWLGDRGDPFDIVIPEHESTRIQFRPNYQLTEGAFEIRVTYTDARGGQPTRTLLRVRQVEATRWDVVALELHALEGAEPRLLARSGGWD